MTLPPPTECLRFIRRTVIFQLAIVELNDAVCCVIIGVVMADYDDSLAPRLQFGKQRVIEHLLKGWVLISSPFVEDINRPVFQVSREERQALALPLRQGER